MDVVVDIFAVIGLLAVIGWIVLALVLHRIRKNAEKNDERRDK